MINKILTSGLSVALAVGAFAQGDDCSTATAVTGLQALTLDTTLLTTSTFDGGGTCAAGASTINQDGFYQWTATVAGDFQFDTFGSGFDTKLSVHSGLGCAATCVAYNDDTNGLQSQIQVPGVIVGDTFLVQVGGFGTNAGAANLNISTFVDPCTQPDDSFEDNDTCAAAVPIPAGVHPGLLTLDTDTDFYSFVIPAGEIFILSHVVNVGGAMDFDLYDSSCTFLQTEFGNFTYTNATGAPFTLIIEAYNSTAAATCSNYDLEILSVVDPCTVPDDAFEDNDDCATATPMGDGLTTGLVTQEPDLDNYAVTVPAGGTLDVTIYFTDALADVDLYLWEAASIDCGTGSTTANWLARGFSATNDETITWDNTSLVDVDYVIEVRTFTGGGCNYYDLEIMGSTGSSGGGVAFCNPANNNSTGLPTRLMGDMTATGGSGLHIEADQGPTGQFGYFLVGTGSSEPGIMLPMSAGRLCLAVGGGNSIGRYNVTGTQFNSLGSFNGSGVLQNLVGTSSTGTGYDVPSTLPLSGSPTIMPGSTWHFQLWHRENAGSSNFSNGRSFTF